MAEFFSKHVGDNFYLNCFCKFQIYEVYFIRNMKCFLKIMITVKKKLKMILNEANIEIAGVVIVEVAGNI